MLTSYVCLIASIFFLVFLIGLVSNLVAIGRHLSDVPPYPVHKMLDGLWNVLTSKFGIHVVCAVGCLVSASVAAISFILMVAKA